MGVSVQSKKHWENVYSTKVTDEVSWFQEHATLSLKLIRDAGISLTASIIDVGAGASTLGDSASAVQWLEANVIEAELPSLAYDVWHDRAVFHFLTTAEDRRAYVRTVLRAVKPGGLVIAATFAEDGPTKCSGLPVMRYDANELHAEFGDAFLLLGHEKESHYTPGGNEQKFIYCICRKLG